MAGAIETYRGTVFPWECDANGHMNVRFYVAKFDEGTWQFMAQIGASREELKRRNCGPMAVSQNIAYTRELVPGDTIVVRSSVIALGKSSCRFRHAPTPTMRPSASASSAGSMRCGRRRMRTSMHSWLHRACRPTPRPVRKRWRACPAGR